jgi:hypothetical protein
MRRAFSSSEITHGAAAEGRIAPIDRSIARHTVPPTRVRFDDAGVHCKALAFDQACVRAATQHFIEQATNLIAVPKTAVSIFGKGRVVGYFIFKGQQTILMLLVSVMWPKATLH